MKRAELKERAIQAVESMQLPHYWQDQPCRLFVVIQGKIKVIEMTAIRSKAGFERVLGRLEGWADVLGGAGASAN